SSDLSLITTLQGLEYVQGLDSEVNNIGLTELHLDGYDLSGDDDATSYDKLVVQILSKAISHSSISSGLTVLSASGCGLTSVNDILDFTPIVSGDDATAPFKLTTLDLSNNRISDVSVFLTEESIFPADVLVSLDISNNYICDIDGVVSVLSENLSLDTLISSAQTCKCTAPVSFADHQVCREVYPDRWAVECWNGYYYNKFSGSCVKATTDSNVTRCSVCERKDNMMAVVEEDGEDIICDCRSAWYGDDCDILVPIITPVPSPPSSFPWLPCILLGVLFIGIIIAIVLVIRNCQKKSVSKHSSHNVDESSSLLRSKPIGETSEFNSYDSIPVLDDDMSLLPITTETSKTSYVRKPSEVHQASKGYNWFLAEHSSSVSEPVPHTIMLSHVPKADSITLSNPTDIVPLCILGHGGFGEVLLVQVKGIPFPCVLKKMVKVGDESVIQRCRKEWTVQRKLFNNPKCFQCIPRPLYILDLLDSSYQGDFGFLMEFCSGFSVFSFSKKWCSIVGSDSDIDLKPYEDTSDSYSMSDEDGDFGFLMEFCSGFSVFSFSKKWCSIVGSDSDIDLKPYEDTSDSYSMSDEDVYSHPLELDPLKVSALCVGMIECLDDVFVAKPGLVHRDIKPDNFLVRIDPKDGECSIVLGDLGLARIQDTISSVHSISKKSDAISEVLIPQHYVCGTLVYNSIEALLEGNHSHLSDAYSLGLSIFTLFMNRRPFSDHPYLRGVYDSKEFIEHLAFLLKKKFSPKLSSSPLFSSLNTLEDGKYVPVYQCIHEIFIGLTQNDLKTRMSVHTARKKVQSIKPLLPKIGEGWHNPSIDEIIATQRKLYDSVGSIQILPDHPK
ncbi:hypothetical protein ADUPG1_007200, partial [Aduncisulcus paluster]